MFARRIFVLPAEPPLAKGQSWSITEDAESETAPLDAGELHWRIAAHRVRGKENHDLRTVSPHWWRMPSYRGL
jgi:hypothetical protein